MVIGGMHAATSSFRGLAGRFPRLLGPVLLLPCLCASCTMAVHSSVHDQTGRPLRDAVVYATPREPQPSPARGTPKATVVLENLEFKPPVLPVRVGTAVSFLNRDDIEHQIYSISAAKNLELAADRLARSPAVVLDKPGAVVLGCANHDGMIGRIYVLETPYFARTGADGKAELEGLPRGAYVVRVWHPDLKSAADPPAQRVADCPGHRVGVDFTLSVPASRPGEGAPIPAAAPKP